MLAHAPSCTARATQACIVAYALYLLPKRPRAVAIGGRGGCGDGGNHVEVVATDACGEHRQQDVGVGTLGVVPSVHTLQSMGHGSS